MSASSSLGKPRATNMLMESSKDELKKMAESCDPAQLEAV